MTTAATSGLAAAPGAAIALRVPASLFSIVMGLGGLAAAWRAAARAYGVSPWVADALLAASAALWIALAVAQVVKAFAAPGRLRAELDHPVDGSLAALAPASLLLLAAGLAVHARDVALVLFWIGAAAQVALCVYAVGRWLTGAIEPKLVTPALYLPPVVGNLLAAAAAGTVGRAEVGWFFFGAGIVAWVLVGATLLGRYLSAGELPESLRPLLGFELAPPAFALVAWQVLAGAGPDEVSRSLHGYGLFIALVLLRLAGRFRGVPFGPAYWAFTFPLAALSTATLRLAAAAPESLGSGLALPLFVVANAVIAVIAFRTATALPRGGLLDDA
jgi:tellurite resistance protein